MSAFCENVLRARVRRAARIYCEREMLYYIHDTCDKYTIYLLPVNFTNRAGWSPDFYLPSFAREICDFENLASATQEKVYRFCALKV